ncbi:hypothetical protein CsatB_007340 [Cannabis sativa]|uniref:uncharacterized protein LOC115724569 n=1 Tax=Cannabis sativa TaxID=3483 RepID=UPI0011DFA7BF|nr:uncharacterized protein LOC115724569 [Cannabis sativa]
MNAAVAQYLEEIGFEKWVRSYFPGVRYNVMTSNWAKSFNNTTKDARGFPITAVVAFLRSKVQKWFASQKEKADKWTKPLAPEMEEDLTLHFEKGWYLNVDSCGPYTLQLHPSRNSSDWWRSGLPGTYLHLRLVPERSISAYTLCSPYYTTEYWRRTYEGTITPVGDEDDWELPDDIKNMKVGVPIEKQPVGRPKKQKVGRIKNNRTACNDERIIKSQNCSKCGAKGHNRSTCAYRC